MRRFLIPFALLFASSAFAQPTEIEVWYSLGQSFGAPQFEEYVQEFNASHPDIEVTASYAGNYENAMQKLQAASAAGAAPQMVHMATVLASGFVDNGVIRPLDDFISAEEDFNRDDFYGPLIEGCEYGDQLYCLPFNTSTPVLYYNRDAFRDAGLDPDAFPTTWEELAEIAPQLSQTNDAGELEQWALGLPATGWHFDAWLGQAGGDFVNEDGTEWVFNDERGMRVIDFWQSMFDADAAKVSSSQTEDFFSGRQVIRMESTAQLENYFDQAQFDLGVAPLWCEAECYAPIGGGSLYLTSSGTEEQQQAAWEFLSWLAEPEQLARFSMATGYFAPRQSAYETSELASYLEERPEARVALDQMQEYGNPERQRVPYINEVRTGYATAFEEIFLADRDPQAALDEVVEEANRLLRVYDR